MTSYHFYAGSHLTKERMDYLETAMNKKIPIFVTEWGTTLSTGNDGFYEINSNVFVKFMNENMLSWCNFHLGDYDFRIGRKEGVHNGNSAIVQHNKWNNSLDDDILTESGKYIKSIMNGTCNSYNNNDFAIMCERDNNTAFWKEEYRKKITYIEFKEEKSVPDNVLISWDISFINKNKVYAYIIQDDTEYKLYIVSDTIISWPINSVYLFSDFTNVEKIVFNNITTSTTRIMSTVFGNDTNLHSIDGLNKFDMSNVNTIASMFTGCEKMEIIDTTGWNTKNINSMINTFSDCRNLTNIIGIEDWDVSNVSLMNAMFQQTYNLEELNLSKWNINNVTSMKFVFAWCGAKSINISNFNLKKTSNMYNMLYSTKRLENLYMNNVEIDESIIENYENILGQNNINMKIYVKDAIIAKFIYERIKENSVVASIFYGSENNWTKFTD